MTSSRHLLSDDTWNYFEQVARKLGYKKKGELSQGKLLLKLLAYADLKENYSLFKV